MKALVTGASGFLGRHIVDRLLMDGHTVKAFDLRTGAQDIEWINDGLANSLSIERACRGVDVVFHLAAHASVRGGFDNPNLDFQINTVGTNNVLMAMLAAGVKRIVFASSGSVYGNPDLFPTPENAPFPVQTSLYAASKVAGEALCEAYAEGYGFGVTILRFASLLGPGYARGHVRDFWRQLKANPRILTILGNPDARRSYVDARDAAAAAVMTYPLAPGVSIYNVAHTELLTTSESARIISEYLRISPTVVSAKDKQGFLGDNPEVHLDTLSLRSLGWKARIPLGASVVDTVKYLEESE